jgi:hypothetical protein
MPEDGSDRDTDDLIHTTEKDIPESAEEQKSAQIRWKLVSLACSASLFAVATADVGFKPDQGPAQRTLAILLVVSSLWVTEAMPPFVTALLVPFLVVSERHAHRPLRISMDSPPHASGVYECSHRAIARGRRKWHARTIVCLQRLH